MASNDATSRCQNHCRAWSARYGASPAAARRVRTSVGSAVAKAACSVATAISEHQRGVIQQGHYGTEEGDPVGEGGGTEHPARALLLLRINDAVLGKEAQRAPARVELDRGRHQLEEDDSREEEQSGQSDVEAESGNRKEGQQKTGAEDQGTGLRPEVGGRNQPRPNPHREEALVILHRV